MNKQLKNVYFVAGCATGGKTTVSKAIAEKYGIILYDSDAEFDRHKKLSNSFDQPAMNRSFNNADEFFLRDIDEYVQWLKDCSAEQLSFIVDDLTELSRHNKVICDIVLTVPQAKQIVFNDQIVFLIRENNDNIIDEYRHRDSHKDFNDFMCSATDPQRARQNCNKILRKLNTELCDEIKAGNFFWIARNTASTVQDTVAAVEKHFGQANLLQR